MKDQAMRPLIVLLVSVAFLGAAGAPSERPSSVMLVAVPTPLPTPAVEPPERSPALDSCERLAQTVLLSIGPGLEPRWQWQYNGDDPTGTGVPPCGPPADSPVTSASQRR